MQYPSIFFKQLLVNFLSFLDENFEICFGNSPQPSCHNRQPKHTVYQQGYFCSAGTVLNTRTRKCVQPNKCPKCFGSVSGDPHYLTYDGLRYDLFDECSHILTKDCIGNTFTVYSITSDKCSKGGVPTCLDQAVIEVPHLQTTITLFSSPLKYDREGGINAAERLCIYQNSDRIVVDIVEFGVTVVFAPYAIQVHTPSSYSGKLCGLLGDCNDNSSDDFKLKNGTVTTDLLVLEREYRAPNIDFDCSYTHTSIEPPVCDTEERARGEEFCSYLTSTTGSYSSCHGVIHPDRSFENCVTDYCYRDDEIVAVCSVIRDYAHECRANGIKVGSLPPECSKYLLFTINFHNNNEYTCVSKCNRI